MKTQEDKKTEEETAETRAIEAEASRVRVGDLNPKIESEKDKTDPPVTTVVGKTTNLLNASYADYV